MNTYTDLEIQSKKINIRNQLHLLNKGYLKIYSLIKEYERYIAPQIDIDAIFFKPKQFRDYSYEEMYNGFCKEEYQKFFRYLENNDLNRIVYYHAGGLSFLDRYIMRNISEFKKSDNPLVDKYLAIDYKDTIFYCLDLPSLDDIEITENEIDIEKSLLNIISEEDFDYIENYLGISYSYFLCTYNYLENQFKGAIKVCDYLESFKKNRDSLFNDYVEYCYEYIRDLT